MKIEKVSIIGVGLIGGSLGLSIKEKNPAWKIVGVGRHTHKLREAKYRGAIDIYTTDFKKGVYDADLVIFAVPVSIISPLLKRVIPYFKRGCIITDVASVKESIVGEIENMLSALVSGYLFFVGAHPMAGSEKSGVENAHVDLFKGATCIITPTGKTDKNALRIVKNIWSGLGSHILLMSPREHDFIIGLTSHLPHIIANCLVKTVGELEKRDKRIKRILAGSFRDMTRIASSNPQVWTDICMNNREAVVKGVEKFKEYIDEMIKDISRGKEKSVSKRFVDAKLTRQRLFNS